YVLFGVLIVVLVVFLLAQLIKRPTGPGDQIFPTLNAKDEPVKAKDIQTVKIKLNQPAEQELLLKRDGQGWRLQTPNVRADGSAVDLLVSQVMGASFDPKAELPSNPAQAGLEPPRAVVTLVGKEGREWTLSVGGSRIGGSDAHLY